MKSQCCIWLLAALACCLSAAPAQAEEGWVDLLPNNTLDLWTTEGNWTIDEQGVITLKPRPGEKGWARFEDYLWLKDKQFKDFEIMFDYKVEKRGNSGFYFHVGEKKSPVKQGIEVQIYDSGSKPEGKRLTDHDSGGIIPGVPPTKNTANPAGEWNTFHIICKGNDLTVKLNGEVVNQVKLNEGRIKDRPESGYIGFQDHALPLYLRNIKIKEL